MKYRVVKQNDSYFPQYAILIIWHYFTEYYPKADTEFSIGFPTESMAIKFIKAEIKARKNGKSIVVVNSEQIEKELEGNK